MPVTLKNVPLVASDPDGKLTVRGKNLKFAIDDKPELNAQQLQDFWNRCRAA
jgi:hypothetical protein